MPWKVCCRMSSRTEFVLLATGSGANVRSLCRRFDVSPKTAYKWIARYQEGGLEALSDRSRRPRRSPKQTTAKQEKAIVSLRSQHPAWGGRKLKRRLEDLGHESVPSASTITAILRRSGVALGSDGDDRKSIQRFEHPHANDLWQMDFKGHFELTRGGRCHPLTILDDHSRYSIGLRACTNERHETVQEELMQLFRRYGMPRRMLMDNGAPWGDAGDQPWTRFTVWLLRVGVSVSHGRAYHPQTQGKEERFHRTLKAEVLRDRSFCDVVDCQREFDRWRESYNHERPHEALNLAVPSSRYVPSQRSFPEVLPPIEYDSSQWLRRVQQGNGRIAFERRTIRIGKAFCGEWVRVRATQESGMYAVDYGEHCVGQFNLNDAGEGKAQLIRLTPVPR
jgi:transposase InsO family protein